MLLFVECWPNAEARNTPLGRMQSAVASQAQLTLWAFARQAAVMVAAAAAVVVPARVPAAAAVVLHGAVQLLQLPQQGLQRLQLTPRSPAAALVQAG